tara:strand:+ start:282 stop:572 length:291 start_codon:yes stop_codon:yes gene_type:complete
MIRTLYKCLHKPAIQTFSVTFSTNKKNISPHMVAENEEEELNKNNDYVEELMKKKTMKWSGTTGGETIKHNYDVENEKWFSRQLSSFEEYDTEEKE